MFTYSGPSIGDTSKQTAGDQDQDKNFKLKLMTQCQQHPGQYIIIL